MHFIRQMNLIVLPWPSRSPDLNPVEHVWDAMKLQIRQKKNQKSCSLSSRNQCVDKFTNEFYQEPNQIDATKSS